MRTRDFLGHLTGELEYSVSGSNVEEFVSGGLKKMRFLFSAPPPTRKLTTKSKVKGIILNYENSTVVNFTNLRYMVLKNTTPVHVHDPKKIKRKHGGVVVSEPETKEYNVVFKKRRFMDNFDSLPYLHD